jgi:hypothetical protein
MQEIVVAKWDAAWCAPVRVDVVALNEALSGAGDDTIILEYVSPPNEVVQAGAELASLKVTYLRGDRKLDSMMFKLLAPEQGRVSRVLVAHKNDTDAHSLGERDFKSYITERLEQFAWANLRRP